MWLLKTSSMPLRDYYLHAAGSDRDVLPLDDAVLDGIRVGGGRDLGLGFEQVR